MPERKLLPREPEIRQLVEIYEQKPEHYEKSLQNQIDQRIARAKEQFYLNLLKLWVNIPYTIDFLETHFDLRMEEGLAELLSQYLNRYTTFEREDNAIIITAWKQSVETEKPPDVSISKIGAASQTRLNVLRQKFGNHVFTVDDAYTALSKLEKTKSFLASKRAIRLFLTEMAVVSRVRVKKDPNNRSRKIYQLI